VLRESSPTKLKRVHSQEGEYDWQTDAFVDLVFKKYGLTESGYLEINELLLFLKDIDEFNSNRYEIKESDVHNLLKKSHSEN